uniref:hypothetical protein n=1 Tax=Rhodothermus marinus TaxID=29549 RepID=UPI001868D676|nr:hypothetical protein [Rhodothermus marinus]
MSFEDGVVWHIVLLGSREEIARQHARLVRGVELYFWGWGWGEQGLHRHVVMVLPRGQRPRPVGRQTLVKTAEHVRSTVFYVLLANALHAPCRRRVGYSRAVTAFLRQRPSESLRRAQAVQEAADMLQPEIVAQIASQGLLALLLVALVRRLAPHPWFCGLLVSGRIRGP